MAKKISELPSSTTPDGDDVVVVNVDGATSQVALKVMAETFESLAFAKKHALGDLSL